MIDDVLQDLRQSIDKTHESLKRELSKVRTGRAHPGILDRIRVDYYGQATPINQMATISVLDPRMLAVRPWEKGQATAIDKAIRESDLGLNPQIDGQLIRIPIPPLTEERRRDMVKLTKRNGEEAKVAIRKHRRDAIDLLDAFKKDGDIGEDEADRAKKKVEEIITVEVKKADETVTEREIQIMEV